MTEIVDEAFKQHRIWRENNYRQQYLDSAVQLKTQINLTLSKWSEKAGYEAGKLLRNLKLKARTRMRPSRLTTRGESSPLPPFGGD